MDKVGVRRFEELSVDDVAEVGGKKASLGEMVRTLGGAGVQMTQLVLGVDRDSAELARLFDERNPAVKEMIRSLISTAHDVGAKVGICGQPPSDYPDIVEFLVEQGIDSMSLNPDSMIPVLRAVAATERRHRTPVPVG